MAKPNAKVMLNAAKEYLKRHPEEIVRALKGAFGLRVGVPLDTLRYVAREFTQGGKVRDIVIDSAAPGVRISLTAEAVGSTLRVSQVLYIEEVSITADEIRIVARIADLTLKVLDGFQTPVAALVQSGALDLSKPGNLLAFIPKRPAMIVDAKDDRVVIDPLKIPKVAQNPKVRRALAIATPVLNVRAIRSKDDHLDVHLSATLSGISEAVSAARS